MVKFATGGPSASPILSNVEVAEIDFGGTHTFDATNLADVSLIQVKGAEGTLSNLATGTDIELLDAATAMTLEVKDAATGTADSLDVALTKVGDQSIPSLTANDIETLNFSTADAGTTTIGTLTADKLTTLDFTEIDGALTITNALANTTAMNLKLGDDDATFILNDNSVNDTITFGNVIGDVEITNFSTTPGTEGDNLDLSVFGITSISELTITDAGDDIEITLADNDDFGKITLIGVPEASEITSDDFTFA